MNRGYQTASKKYREQNQEGANETTRDTSSTNPPPSQGGGGMDFSSLFGSMGGGRAGTPDLASLMNNPMLMNMAQQMASSGAFNDIINNPRMREMAQQMMSGERNLGDVLNDPDVQNLLLPRCRIF